MITASKKFMAIIAFSILFSGCHLSIWENALISFTADAIFWAYDEGEKIKDSSNDSNQPQEVKTPINNGIAKQKSEDQFSDTFICPSTEKRLQRLKYIYENGLITEDDYENTKARILKDR